MDCRTAITTVLLFLSASADIIVQPGYGQPGSGHRFVAGPVQRQGALQTGPGTYQLSRSPSGSPYYLGVQPIYQQRQAQSGLVGEPRWHYPAASHYPHHRPEHYAKLGGMTVVRPSVFLGQAPTTAAHHRYRRSEGSVVGQQEKSADSKTVATDTTLGVHPPSPVDLPDQGKESKSEVTASDTLLGLDPSNMSPEHQPNVSSEDEKGTQPRHIKSKHHEHHHGRAQFANPKADGLSSENTIGEPVAVQNKVDSAQLIEAVASSRDAGSPSSDWKLVTPDGQVITFSPTNSQMARNFPDPRPLPKVKSPPVYYRDAEEVGQPDEATGENPSTDEVVGTVSKLNKRKFPKGHAKLHQLKVEEATGEDPPTQPVQPVYTAYPYTGYPAYPAAASTPNCNCPCPSHPNYVILKDNCGCQTQPLTQAYSLSYAPQSYTPSSYVTTLPQSSVNYNSAYAYTPNSVMTYYV